MSDLIFSPAAQTDIDGIYDYTAENWGVAQAGCCIGDLRDVCHGLSEGTRQGWAVDYIRVGYRRTAAGSRPDRTSFSTGNPPR